MEFLYELLTGNGVPPGVAVYVANVAMVLLIVGLSVVANVIAKKIVVRVLAPIIARNRFKWDNVLLERNVFQKLSHIVPALIIYYFASVFPQYQQAIEKGAVAYMIIAGMLVADAFLNACNDIYSGYEVSKARPIRGYVQVVKIFVFIIGGIVVVANLIGENPLILLSGLGALSAVLMLIFKDSILGLVAGVQLSANDMVRVGDWIEMPKYNADGDVIDISLNTVKVRNFDKTITTIPSYALIADSFRNWRGMEQSGGRRIKRSVWIDTSSIRFCSGGMLERFRKIHLLTDYIAEKETEIAEYNELHRVDKSVEVNGRQLTNIGVFRVYIQNYLKQHPNIHHGMTTMVRQLASGETGLPLEIYTFTNITGWGAYESIQADIFDHIFAVAPAFELRVFQNPTGYDFRQALRGGPEAQ